MPRVERLTVYPVKSLDGLEVDEARITAGGTLEHDREFALFDGSGEPINGVRTRKVHGIATGFDAETNRLTVREKDTGGIRQFDLVSEREAAEDWFGDYFGVPVSIERRTDGGFPDRPTAGPSVISTATLERVASWFPDVSVEGLRRRLRANVEVGGVPAFWEDRFVDGSAFHAGGVRIRGVEPCARCVVPERDPETGDRDPEFRRRFVEKRRETLPEWVDGAGFDHFYQVMLIAEVPEDDRGGKIAAGDAVSEDVEPVADADGPV